MINEKISSLFHKAKGTTFLLKTKPVVAAINRAEADVDRLTDTELKEAFLALKSSAMTQPLGSLLPQAFALAREASKRTLGVRHYDVQLQGAIALHEGKLAEMRTGEGKTHVIVLAAALNALRGEGVHVVTANAYLAARDAELLRPVYEALGLTVGVTLDGMTPIQKQLAYQCDVTYGVNYEFAFDYLRDNMARKLDDRVQRGLVYAIVDEVDSILIDDARTPLIISEEREVSSSHYVLVDEAVKRLVAGQDYTRDEKLRSATLTETGFDKLERILEELGLVSRSKGLYREEDLAVFKAVNASLLAHAFYRRDRDYVVQNGEIVIVDDATGRLMQGRRWSNGLHHAVEARERVKLQPESLTVGTITYQNFFSLYQKLAGLSGTAATEAEEFVEIYGLATVVIPTHRPIQRATEPDLVFVTKKAKYRAIVADVHACQRRGQPVLVGTASVQESERLSQLFVQAGIRHQVLNAKQNSQEAAIVADAGLPGAVTIATNMAGRGTDILLGGHKDSPDPDTWALRNAQALAAGGLHVVGTERNESRRVDNQLEGRAGRQGDPGSSQFYLSAEDDLLRIFGNSRLPSLLQTLTGDPEGGVSHRLLDKFITTAQRKIESRNFEARRDLMKFDGVLAAQRQAVFSLRDSVLKGEVGREVVTEMLEDAVRTIAGAHVGERGYPHDDNLRALEKALFDELRCPILLVDHCLDEGMTAPEVAAYAAEKVVERYLQKRGDSTEDLQQQEKDALLAALDGLWPLHLQELDETRQGISLRQVAQENPVHAFAREGKALFLSYRAGVCAHLAKMLLNPASTVAATPGEPRPAPAPAPTADAPTSASAPPAPSRLSRNAPCHCGSGERFKDCHGSLKAA